MSLTAIEYRSLEQELTQPKKEWIWDEEDANKWYVCIRAADLFFNENGKYPSPGNEDKIREHIATVIKLFGLEDDNGESIDIEDKFIEEM